MSWQNVRIVILTLALTLAALGSDCATENKAARKTTGSIEFKELWRIGDHWPEPAPIWSPDGRWILLGQRKYGTPEKRIDQKITSVVSADGRKVTKIADYPTYKYSGWVDERRVWYAEQTPTKSGWEPIDSICVFDVVTGERTRVRMSWDRNVLIGPAITALPRRGELVYFRDGTLRARSIEHSQERDMLKDRLPPGQIVESLMPTGDGKWLLIGVRRERVVSLLVIRADGGPEQPKTISESADWYGFDASSNGRRVVYLKVLNPSAVPSDFPQYELHVLDLGTNRDRVLVATRKGVDDRIWSPSISPDGRNVAYTHRWGEGSPSAITDVRLFVYDLPAGITTEVPQPIDPDTDTELSFSGPAIWSADSRYFVCGTIHKLLLPRAEHRLAQLVKSSGESASTSAVAVAERAASARKDVRHYGGYVVATADGKRLNNLPADADEVRWHPTRSRLAVSRRPCLTLLDVK